MSQKSNIICINNIKSSNSISGSFTSIGIIVKLVFVVILLLLIILVFSKTRNNIYSDGYSLYSIILIILLHILVYTLLYTLFSIIIARKRLRMMDENIVNCKLLNLN